MKIGATAGAVVFIALGIIPGFYFGSYGALFLLQNLMGGTVEPTLFVRMAVVMGMAIGIACAAAISLVVGGLAGTLIGYLLSVPSAIRARQIAEHKA